MRKIIVGARISIDGVMQAPSGPAEDLDKGFEFGGWARPFQDQDCGEEFDRLFLGEKYDLLLGRKTYEIFARYWPHQVWEDVPNGGIPKVFNAIRKYVVSGSGEVDTSWQGSVLLRGIADVKRLRDEDGPNLLTQGSTELVNALLDQRPRRRDDHFYLPGRARRRQDAVRRRVGAARVQADKIAHFE